MNSPKVRQLLLIFLIIAALSVVVSVISMFIGSFDQSLVFTCIGTSSVFIVLLSLFLYYRKDQDNKK